MLPRLPRYTLAVLVVVVLFLTTLALRPVSATGPGQPLDAIEFNKLCEGILTRALTLTEQGCNSTGRNQACYGYTLVQSTLQPGLDESTHPFVKGGDIQPVRVFQVIHTMPLNVEDGTWGMAMLKMQANLPDTNPGQNVTFILFGDTELEPDANHTNAFYLSTELGGLACRQIPQNSLMVRAPTNTTVTFEVNGVEISASSIVVLRAAPTGKLLARVLEGHVAVTAANSTQQVMAGQEVTVPMAGPDFRSPAGPPSEPAPAEWENTLEAPTQLVNTLDPTADNYTGPIVLEGPIEAVNPGMPSLTLYGQIVKINKVGCWKDLRPGDWVHIEGTSLGYMIQAVLMRSSNPACTQAVLGGPGQLGSAAGGSGGGKITICHRPPGNPDPGVTITISASAWKIDGSGEGGHGPGRHGGDTEGPCPSGSQKGGKGGGKK
jgi:hypothetical protein